MLKNKKTSQSVEQKNASKSKDVQKLKIKDLKALRAGFARMSGCAGTPNGG